MGNGDAFVGRVITSIFMVGLTIWLTCNLTMFTEYDLSRVVGSIVLSILIALMFIINLFAEGSY
jgi:hypothetical protein